MSKARKIHGHTVIFSVDNNARKVTAKIYGCDADALLYIKNVTKVHALEPCDDFYMRNSYSASATCAPGDQFNVELGERIAYRRLLKKYLRYRNARIYKFYDFLGRCRRDLMLRHTRAAYHASVIDPLEGVN